MGYHDNEEDVLTGAEKYRQRIEEERNKRERVFSSDVDGLTDDIEVVAALGGEDEGEAQEGPPTDGKGREITLLGKWVRDRRKVLGISQYELSVRARIPQSQVSQVEVNAVHPLRPASDALAKGLGMPPGQFWNIVTKSRDAWRYGAVSQPDRVSITGYVVPEAKLLIAEEAKARGIQQSRYVGELLERHYNSRKDK